MNIALPVILIIIANLIIYWLFFGKKKFEDKLEKEVKKNVR